MKKFYLLSLAFMAFFATTKAQISTGVCPGGSPIFIRNIQFVTSSGQTYCIIILDNTWPDAEVVVRGKQGGTDVIIPSLAPAPSADGVWRTGNDSSLVYQYDCNTYFAEKIEVSKFGQGTCTTIIPPQAPLPIKLTGFTGKLQSESTVRLDFTSTLEINSAEYQIQRSADGKNFTTVGTIKAAGSSAHDIKYNFVDQLPAAGDYFYRLKQVDIDGFFEYSKVVYVNSRKGAGIVTKVFPNPFVSEVQLIGATSADLNKQGNIRIFNMSGQQVKFRIVGANAIAIDPSAPKGLYFLEFNNNNFKQTFKLAKQY
ncbi:T9SS type A sorting domain-containing protein [Longitalea arenae]|uniref:T9SS type A sorting domain-containing protein n=1 Tax=Longitalea arenae TaxID=2812558 RepID=UPI0019684AD5|nr:T9SS type A sorting domain-containing protein [Longitalea arenae]